MKLILPTVLCGFGVWFLKEELRLKLFENRTLKGEF